MAFAVTVARLPAFVPHVEPKAIPRSKPGEVTLLERVDEGMQRGEVLRV